MISSLVISSFPVTAHMSKARTCGPRLSVLRWHRRKSSILLFLTHLRDHPAWYSSAANSYEVRREACTDETAEVPFFHISGCRGRMGGALGARVRCTGRNSAGRTPRRHCAGTSRALYRTHRRGRLQRHLGGRGL